MIDERTLEELIKIGRTNGRITTEDVRRVVPIGLVPLEEIASLILQLEEAGIELDLDPALLRPGPGRPVPLRPVGTQAHTDSRLDVVQPRSEVKQAHGLPEPPLQQPDPVRRSTRSIRLSAAVLIALGTLMLVVLFLLRPG